MIDLLTHPQAAQREEMKHNATQGRGVNPFIILTCEIHVSENTHIHCGDHQGLKEVVPPDEVKKKESEEHLFKIL